MKQWRGDQYPRVKKERKANVERKVENAFSGKQRDNIRKETHVVSAVTPAPVAASGNGGS